MFGWFLTDTTLREQFDADGEHDMIDKEGKKDCLPETKTRMGTDAVKYSTFLRHPPPYEAKLQFSRGRGTRKYNATRCTPTHFPLIHCHDGGTFSTKLP